VALALRIVTLGFDEIFFAERHQSAVFCRRALGSAPASRVLLVANALGVLETRLLAPVDCHDELIAAATRRVPDQHTVGFSRAGLVESREALIGARAADVAGARTATAVSARTPERDYCEEHHRLRDIHGSGTEGHLKTSRKQTEMSAQFFATQSFAFCSQASERRDDPRQLSSAKLMPCDAQSLRFAMQASR
jgi:hypothetical protein